MTLADIAENGSLMALAKLGRWVLDIREKDDCEMLNREEIKHKAADLGLLAGINVTENCGDYCNCVGYDDFPLTCFRLTDKAKVLDK